MESKLKHLEFIQGVVSRMGGNMFFLRGWAVTLVAAYLAVIAQSDENIVVLTVLAFVLTVVFWVYDGYFLSLERKYRALYDKVRQLPDGEVDFSMRIGEFNANAQNTLLFCVFSKTVVPFYVILLAAETYFFVGGLI